MNSRHLVDKELAPFLDVVPAFDLDNELAATRTGFSSNPPIEAPPVTGVTRTEVKMPGRDGAPPVRALVYKPDRGGVNPGVLHLHGGGYVVGSPEMMDLWNRYACVDIGCTIVSVDYRLAPETPFPGPVEDCYAGLQWLHANADELGVDRNRIAVKGESAGGGLAAALALLARDRKEIALVYQHLVYPMLDDRTASQADADPNPYTGQYLWTHANNRSGWRAMLGHEGGTKEVSPYVAPARAKDLTGLPPTFIQVGSLDLFLDEDMEYARRLLRAGVPTELHIYPGGFHGLNMFPATRIRAAFERDGHEALRRGLLG